MSNWKESMLKDIGAVVSGGTPSTANSAYWNGNILFVTPYDLSRIQTPFISDSDRKITQEGLKESSANILPVNSIVISSRAPIGYIAIGKKEFTTNQGCKSLIPNPEFDSTFLYYSILHHVERIKRKGEGTTFAEISKSDLEKIKIPHPVLKSEQEKIARILLTVDSVIESTQAAITKYKAMKQGMMLDLFTYGLDLNNRKNKIIDKTKFKPISHFAKVRRGASPRPIDNPEYFGGNVGWVRISDVTSSNKYLRKTDQYVSPLGESLSVRVNKGDIVMSICATVGRPVIIDMPACIHDGFVQLYDLKEIDLDFLYYTLQFSEKALERKGQPGTQVNLNSTIVENFVVYYPNLKEQIEIGKALTAIDEKINYEQAYLSKIKLQKQGLMADLLGSKNIVESRKEIEKLKI